MNVKYVKKGILSLALVCTMMTPISIKASEAITGEGYSYNPDTQELTIKSNEGTTAWREAKPVQIDYQKITKVTVLDGVTIIKKEAFWDCGNITKVTLPEGLTTIEASSFEKISDLDINLPDSIKTIGDKAFLGTGINTTLPKGLRSIGKHAFQLSNMETVIFPQGLTEIGEMSFYSSMFLKTVVLPNTITTIQSEALALAPMGVNPVMYSFAKTPPTLIPAQNSDNARAIENFTKIYVPVNLVDAYRAAWSDFKDIIEAIPTDTLSLEIAKTELAIKETTQATAKINLEIIDDGIYTLASSDSSIASVDATGKITALKAGTVKITATNASTGLTNSQTVTVKGDPTPTPTPTAPVAPKPEVVKKTAAQDAESSISTMFYVSMLALSGYAVVSKRNKAKN